MSFSWIPIYKELSNKLCDYENRQNELLKILEELNKKLFEKESFIDKDKNDNKIKLSEIDPFTFYSYFNRNLTEDKRKIIIKSLKDYFNLTSDIPNDFDGIPIMNSQKMWFFGYKKDRNEKDIPKLWKLFIEIVKKDNIDSSFFNDVLKIEQVGIANITMGLFWIKPDVYIGLDKNTKEYANLGRDLSKGFNFEKYIEIIKIIKDKFSNKKLFEISYDAWKSGKKKCNYWIFQANPERWDIFKALSNNQIFTWEINQHKKEIKKDDCFIIYVAGNEKGIYATGKIISDVLKISENKEEKIYDKEGYNGNVKDRVYIEIINNWINKPLLLNELKKNGKLKNLKIGNQGTNFSMTESEFNEIISMQINNFGVNINLELIQNYLTDYKEILKGKKGNYNEIYKFEAIKNFQDNWNIEADNFYEMFDKSFNANSNNLWASNQYYPKKMILEFINIDKEKVRNMFYDLFNEEKKLEERINSFIENCKLLLSKINLVNKEKNYRLHYHNDMRAISLYLTFKYPDKYFLYKYEMFKSFLELMDIKPLNIKDSGYNKYNKYLIFMNKLRKILSKDNELKEIIQRKLNDNCYKDETCTVLSQDFIWVTLSNYNEKNKGDIMKNNIETNLPLNTIFYGPPGTGKTFNTINYALKIILEKEDKEIEIPLKEKKVGIKIIQNILNNNNYNENERKILSDVFNYYKDKGQIDFVSFHQSYSYEEFVEGIKPFISSEEEIEIKDEDSHNELKYIKENGIFKKICDRASRKKIINSALNELISNESTVYKISLFSDTDPNIKESCFKEEYIRIGWDDTGDLNELFKAEDKNKYYQELGRNDKNTLFYFYNLKNGDIVLSLYDQKTIDGIGIVDGNYEFDNKLSFFKHKRKVKWIIKNKNIDIFNINKGINLTQPTVYKLSRISPNDILNIIKENDVSKNEIIDNPNNYVLIIDEINRGNVSKIFGELITLIEDDKRKGEKNELSLKLAYSNSKTENLFSVPSNLYLIGTMNTSDRSIEVLDTALRRRFSFIEFLPQYELLEGIVVKENDKELIIKNLLKIINDRIEVLYDRDHVIGHSYFMNLIDDNSLKNLKIIFKDKIIPLLQEYFYSDLKKLYMILGSDFIKVEKNDKITFFKEKESSYEDDYQDKYLYNIESNIDNWTIESFINILNPENK